MDSLAVLLLALFAGGYLVLAGADIGVGMLLPWLGRDQRERRLVIASFAPFFLGNEVWLVASAGLVAGAFPGLEHRLLEELYPLVVVLLIGWVVRDMGLWLRGRVDAAAWRSLWDGAIVAGSWALALAWGSVLGSVVAGGGLRCGSAAVAGGCGGGAGGAGVGGDAGGGPGGGAGAGAVRVVGAGDGGCAGGGGCGAAVVGGGGRGWRADVDGGGDGGGAAVPAGVAGVGVVDVPGAGRGPVVPVGGGGR